MRDEAEGKVRPRVFESLLQESPGVSDRVKLLDTGQVVGRALSSVSSYSQHSPTNIDQGEAEPPHHHLSHGSPGLVGPTRNQTVIECSDKTP